jgi:Fe-S cluster assembly scaffold protein SufB
LEEKGRIHAIPELESYHQDVELSHEAAIGKISDDELNYLMSRGLNEEEATATIVRGFLDLEIKGLPEQISSRIRETVQLLDSSSL